LKRFRIDNPYYIKDERGSVIIIVAVLMVVLLGMTAMAVDVGDLYQNRREMVNAADAAAMAGVQQFLETDNQAEIEKFARDFAIDNYGCAAALVEAEADMIDYTVWVKTGKPVEYTFARIFGLTSTDVTSEAKAVIRKIAQMEGLIPIHMQEDFFNTIIGDPDNLDETYDFVQFHQLSYTPGNWGWVYFEWRENKHSTIEYLEHGYPYELPIGYGGDDKTFASNTGFNVQNVEDILQHHKENESKLYIPISEPTEISGKTELTIVGFAAIQITGYVISGPQDFKISGKILSNELADQPQGPNVGGDFDIRSIFLTSID